MGDTATTTRPRTNPVAMGEYDGELPKQERRGFWKSQHEDVFTKNPGKVYQFRDVSPTTASNLRKDYGLNAVSQTRKDEQGNDIVYLFVKWEPEKAEQIKQDVIDRGAKRKATMEANKAKNAAKSTGRQTAGNRS